MEKDGKGNGRTKAKSQPEAEQQQEPKKKRKQKPSGKSQYHKIFYTGEKRDIKNAEAWAELERMVKAGIADRQLAVIYKVDLQTLDFWKIRYPEFATILDLNKDRFDDNLVIRSTYERAMGFTVKDQKAYVVGGQIKIVDLKKEIPPDNSAQQFWLTNRQPDKWKNRSHAHTNVIQTSTPQQGIDLTALSDEELNYIENIIQRQQAQKQQ